MINTKVKNTKSTPTGKSIPRKIVREKDEYLMVNITKSISIPFKLN